MHGETEAGKKSNNLLKASQSIREGPGPQTREGWARSLQGPGKQVGVLVSLHDPDLLEELDWLASPLCPPLLPSAKQCIS